MPGRSPLLATALALSITVLAAPAVVAGGPSTPVVIRTAPSGTDLQIVDGTAVEDFVGGAWVEVQGGTRDLGSVTSENGGISWIGPFPPLEDAQAPRMSLCAADLFASTTAYTKLVSGDRAVTFILAPTTVTYADEDVVYSRPDTACIPGKRAIGVALRTVGGSTRLHLYSRNLAADPVDVTLDLGPANKGSTPAVAAMGDRVYVAWTQGTKLRFKRYTVGAAPGYALTAKPTVTLEDTSGQGSPRMDADGTRVVLAWERKGSVVARVSTNKGVSFGARKTLFQGAPVSAKVAFVTNADSLGETLIVSAAVVSEGISVRSSVRRSTNGGSTWTKVPGTEKTTGFVVGVLGGTSGSPRLHVFWDERINPPELQRIQAVSID